MIRSTMPSKEEKANLFQIASQLFVQARLARPESKDSSSQIEFWLQETSKRLTRQELSE